MKIDKVNLKKLEFSYIIREHDSSGYSTRYINVWFTGLHSKKSSIKAYFDKLKHWKELLNNFNGFSLEHIERIIFKEDYQPMIMFTLRRNDKEAWVSMHKLEALMKAEGYELGAINSGIHEYDDKDMRLGYNPKKRLHLTYTQIVEE